MSEGTFEPLRQIKVMMVSKGLPYANIQKAWKSSAQFLVEHLDAYSSLVKLLAICYRLAVLNNRSAVLNLALFLKNLQRVSFLFKDAKKPKLIV